MIRGCLLLAAMSACASVSVAGARLPEPRPLALLVVTGAARPELVLAQRTIEREWTVGDDVEPTLSRQGLRSELGAAALSGALPGAGQLYAGESRGFLFAAAEVAGWVGLVLFGRQADDRRDAAAAVAGVPADSASGWSFDRYEGATLGDIAPLQQLYAADPEAFFDAIVRNPDLAAGWATPEIQQQFRDLRNRADRSGEQSRWAGAALWVNHLLAAADALRAARLSNVELMLAGDVEMKVRGSLRHGRPAFRMALERRF